jgi:hypothetical protein
MEFPLGDPDFEVIWTTNPPPIVRMTEKLLYHLKD